MKIVCTQSDLNNSLSLVSRAVPSRPTHPVLANILFRADKETGQVTLTAFDLSLGIRSSFITEVIESGEIAVPSKLLVDIISKLSEGDLIIDDQIALFATSSDETKQILTGVHLILKEETLEFAATDGHRLAVIKIEDERPVDNHQKLEATIPAKALRELQKMLSTYKSEEDVAVYLDRGQVVFAWQNQRLTSRTLEGEYPAYHQLIPRQFERRVTLERKQFISTLERIAVLADQKNNIVKLSIDNENQEITLSCEAQDVGSGTESMPAQISGENIDIAFNVKYLMEGLKELPSSEIQMHLNQSLTPVIFTPLSKVKMTYLAMPVQVRN